MAKTVGDMSGEVVELGSGVTNFKPGDKVISISFPVTFSLPIPFTPSLQLAIYAIEQYVTNLPSLVEDWRRAS